ncbi:MAG: glucose 1-dehydrogenase [Anaerolineales bacterium]|nr:glucose 1-dehydrogenase [Anaerolineales bacterium]
MDSLITQLFDLTGRVAVVTGAGSGLGRAMSIGMAQAGASVVASDLDPATAAETAKLIQAAGGQALSAGCDTRLPEAITALFSAADTAYGRVDILINNAGTGSAPVHPEDLSLADWQNVFAVNITGYFLCAQAAAQRMIPQQKGAILNIGSIGGVSTLGRGNFAYDISKAAVHHFTKELAVYWGRHSIRVNAIAPCQIQTPALQQHVNNPTLDADAVIKRFLTGIPLRRLGVPEDLVGPAIFLVSDAAGMVTGTTLGVDGGNLALNGGGTHEW